MWQMALTAREACGNKVRVLTDHTVTNWRII